MTPIDWVLQYGSRCRSSGRKPPWWVGTIWQTWLWITDPKGQLKMRWLRQEVRELEDKE